MKIIFFSLVLFFSQLACASDLVLAEQVKWKSTFLAEERNLLIKLPDAYEAGKAIYPVIYLLHGQWDMLSTLSTLDLMEDQLPDFIVIGVESKGMELKPDEGKATAFANYLTQEVVPYVNKHYDVAPLTILSGHSNAGRFVLDLWLANPGQFSQYYAFSPSLEDGYIVERLSKFPLESLQGKAPLTMTIANEGEHMQTPFETVTQYLSKQPKLSFFHRKFSEQSHRTTKHTSMQFALQSTFMGWTPSYEVQTGGLEGLKKHYAELTTRFGFKVEIPTETLQKLTAHYAISEQDDAAENLKRHIAFTIAQSSKGADALVEVADYLSNNGYETSGGAVLKGVCNHAKKHERCKI